MNGDIKPVEFMARLEDWSGGISLHARQVIEGVGQCIAKPLDLVKPLDLTKVNSNLATVPFLQLTLDSGQQLMDELWRCGLRPSEGTGSAGSLAATQAHLKDMQKLVFKNE